MYYRQFARKARPILRERDYSAAKRILRESARFRLQSEDEERMEALLREIVAYESDHVELHDDRAVAFTEYVPVPPAACESGPARRWSDQVDEDSAPQVTSRAWLAVKVK
jgi:hypothetical protein